MEKKKKSEPISQNAKTWVIICISLAEVSPVIYQKDGVGH